MQQQISALEKQVYISAKTISEKRKAVGSKLSSEVESLLANLGMKDARFAVSINEKPGNDIEQKCGLYGMDNIEFLISANLGSALLPLAKVASGGEMSRVMLAIKTHLMKNLGLSTIIFDEIDTGISGRTAQMVSEKMAQIGANHQILCITHLSQIASMADAHFLIEKGVEDGRTKTAIKELATEEIYMELARMLGGAEITSAVVQNAKEMKLLADKIKTY